MSPNALAPLLEALPSALGVLFHSHVSAASPQHSFSFSLRVTDATNTLHPYRMLEPQTSNPAPNPFSTRTLSCWIHTSCQLPRNGSVVVAQVPAKKLHDRYQRALLALDGPRTAADSGEQPVVLLQPHPQPPPPDARHHVCRACTRFVRRLLTPPLVVPLL